MSIMIETQPLLSSVKSEYSDPMISSALYEEFLHQQPLSMTGMSMSMDFEPSFPQYEQVVCNDVHDTSMQHSPISDSVSEMELPFQDSGASVSSSCSSPPYSEEPSTPATPGLVESQSSADLAETDLRHKADMDLLVARYSPHEFYTKDRVWTLEEKAHKLVQHSPCEKYTVDDLLNLNMVEKPDDKISALIEVVAHIPVAFRWHFVKPEELFRPYTTVANCKKEKVKRDADGHVIPKRPMNAFMIWCQKCRTLMAHICPQLHNAIISKALGAVWKTFTKEDRLEYELEKKALDVFHKHEYPDYKYRPKKKVKKGAAPPTETAAVKLDSVTTKSKSKKKKKKDSVSSQPAPLKAINLAEMQHNINLDPLVKERLQVKMQVKIDPDFKREMGKRATAIDLADLSTYLANVQNVSVDPDMDNNSSVFDTPENSPKTGSPSPRSINNNTAPSPSFPAAVAFKFEPSIVFAENNNNTNNNNNNITSVMTIKTEPGALPANLWQTRIIKTEPGLQQTVQPQQIQVPVTQAVVNDSALNLPLVEAQQSQTSMDLEDIKPTISGGIPLLSADYVQAVFEANDSTLTINNLSAAIQLQQQQQQQSLAQLTMSGMDTLDTDFMKFFPDGSSEMEDLLKIDSSSLVMEGPATV